MQGSHMPTRGMQGSHMPQINQNKLKETRRKEKTQRKKIVAIRIWLKRTVWLTGWKTLYYSMLAWYPTKYMIEFIKRMKR